MADRPGSESDSRGGDVDRLKGAFYGLSRTLESVLPLDLLWWLLLPLSALLAARHLRRSRVDLPVRSLPRRESDPKPSEQASWRHLTEFQTHWWLLGWLDRLGQPRWQRRIEWQGVEHLHRALIDRPVIVVTLHTTSVVALAALIRSLGITTAAAPADQSWFRSSSRLRKVALAEELGATVFRRGASREIIDYLRPGRAIVLPVDHVQARSIDVACGEATVTVGTGPFRLARATGSALVPVLITSSGPWRYRIDVLPPAPQAHVESGSVAGSASYVVAQLLPLAAREPDQAMQTLVDAVIQTRSVVSETRSG